MDNDLEALSWPSLQAEPLTGKGRLPAADQAAQNLLSANLALTAAQALVKMMAESPLTSKDTQLQLAKEVTTQTANVTAAQKAVDAAPSALAPAEKTPKLQLVNAQGRLSKQQEAYLEWHAAATARKMASELSMTQVANRYSELAAALLAEKQLYLEKARECVTAWDAKNQAIDTRMTAAMAAFMRVSMD